jgi:hypothetical protein
MEVNCTEPSPSVRLLCSNWRGKLSTVDLLIKVICFVKKLKNIFKLKSSWSKPVSTKKSTVHNISLQLGFPALTKGEFDNIINLKSNWSKPVSTRRSTVQSRPLQLGFPAPTVNILGAEICVAKAWQVFKDSTLKMSTKLKLWEISPPT